MMNSYAVWKQLFKIFAVNCFSLDNSFDNFLAFRVWFNDSVQIIFGKSSIFQIVSSSHSISSRVNEDNHLKISNPLHHLVIKNLVYHQHFSHAFFLCYSYISLLKRNRPIALIKIKEPLLLDSQHSSNIFVVRKSCR